MNTTTLERQSVERSGVWLARGLRLALVLTCAWALSHNLADSDLWGHVQFGQDALDYGLPACTTYAYTVTEYPWINHENLSELLLAAGVRWLGPGGLVAVQSLLGALILVWMYRQGHRQGVPEAPLCACLLLVTLNLMHSWTLRPQLLTYLLFSLMLMVFEHGFAGWRTPWRALAGHTMTAEGDGREVAARVRRLRWLWLLVPLMIVWTNAHGGFVAGYCILSTYLGGRAGEALVRYRRIGLPIVARCLACWLACGLATLVNPYGAGLHRWMLRVLGTPWREIVEWNSPELTSLIGLFWIAITLVALAALVCSRRPHDLVQLAILGVTFWQGCEHRRHIVFFALLFGYWLPGHVASLFARFQPNAPPGKDPLLHAPRMRWALAGLLLVATGLLASLLGRRWREIPVERNQYPVAAFAFITDHRLSGNLVVRFKWSQYAIAAFGPSSSDRPRLRVAFDGRLDTCYPQDVVDMYFDFALGNAPPSLRSRSGDAPPIDSSRILTYRNPNLVLIDRAQKYAVRVMQQHDAAWTLLYQDAVAQLWGRRDWYDNPRHTDYLPPEERVIGDAEQVGSVPWPALPRPLLAQLSPQPQVPSPKP